jgi:hypothetical protein
MEICGNRARGQHGKRAKVKAKDLKLEFSGQNGFSVRNLRLMALFYSEYKDDTIWQPLAAKISFTHNMIAQSD